MPRVTTPSSGEVEERRATVKWSSHPELGQFDAVFTIDITALMQEVSWRAAHNKSGKSQLMGGLVKVVMTRRPKEG